MSAKTILQTLATKSGVDLSLIQVHDQRVYQRVMRDRNLGMGESYMEGWWDCPQLDKLFCQIKSARAETCLQLSLWMWLRVIYLYLLSFFVNFQSQRRSMKVGVQHYDLDADLYAHMLDKRMIYSCGYWGRGAKELDQAQEAKLDLICRKLKLRPGMKVIDIGCGYGGFARYAAETHGVHVLGITISKQQLKYARRNNIVERKKKGDGSTEFEFMDYRKLLDYGQYQGYFDAVVSIGAFEHFGAQNYRTFMKVTRYLMKETGLSLLHTIGGPKSRLENDPWFEKYIFPNSLLPTIKQIGAATEGILVMEDLHNFGPDYDKTLMAWHRKFNANFDTINYRREARNKPTLDRKFKRMWNYYLLSSAGMFRSRHIQLYQIVLSKGLKDGYIGIR